MTHHPLTAIVLAGGQSRRMGQDKALLPIEGQPMLHRVLQRLKALSGDLIVATNDSARYADIILAHAARAAADAVPGAGPLSGMSAGLQMARHEQAIIVACDMPFLNPDLLRWMAGLLPGHDAVVPRVAIVAADRRPSPLARARDVDLHPLHAVYHRSCLAPMQAALEQGRRSLGDLLAGLRVRIVEANEIAGFDPQFLSLRNINTPEDYESFRVTSE